MSRYETTALRTQWPLDFSHRDACNLLEIDLFLVRTGISLQQFRPTYSLVGVFGCVSHNFFHRSKLTFRFSSAQSNSAAPGASMDEVAMSLEWIFAVRPGFARRSGWLLKTRS